MHEIKELAPGEVLEAVNAYTDEKVTPHLYDLGKLLTAQVDANVIAIDTKASWILAYGVATLGFILTRIPEGAAACQVLGYIVAGLCALGSCWWAFLALQSAQNWKGISERSWFNRAQMVEGPDAVQRYYVVALHRAFRTNFAIQVSKARYLVRSQLFLALAGGALALTIAGAVIAGTLRAPDSKTSGTCSCQLPDQTEQPAAALSAPERPAGNP